MITAKVIAHSKNQMGDEIATMVVTMPRYILAEFNTHRMFSRNSASSRAIPFNKMVKMVKENPFIPIAWQEDHKGMQGTSYLDEVAANNLDSTFRSDLRSKEILEGIWAKQGQYERPNGTALYHMIEIATELNKYGVTKQLANRLLEPFMWHTVLVTSTEWENFFKLRCPQYIFKVGEDREEIYRSRKDLIKELPGLAHADNRYWLTHNSGQADIHMMATAEAMWDALNESTPKELKAGEWHMPYGDNLDTMVMVDLLEDTALMGLTKLPASVPDIKIKIATARCARTSYNDFEGNSQDYVKDIQLHDRLLQSGHWSPFEHCARAMNDIEYRNYSDIKHYENRVENGWCRNFKGFIQYRSLADS